MGNYSYQKITTTTEYVKVDFGGAAKNVNLVTSINNAEDILFSWDGSTLDGEIELDDTLFLGNIGRSYIYIKSASGGQEVKVFAWKSDWV